MKTSRLVLTVICLLLFLSAVVAITLRSRSQTPSPQAAQSNDPQPRGSIAVYKQWTRVNPEPARIPGRSATLCAVAGLGPAPHDDKYITVYVNDVGRHAMLEEKTPHFPQGSIIVKEKLTTATSSTPELLTVMLKRESGYNPGNGDWEYMVVNGDGRTVQERGKLDNCQMCHNLDRANDYVSRSYLPAKVEARLK